MSQNTEIFNAAEMINWELDQVFDMNDTMNTNARTEHDMMNTVAGHDSIDLMMNYVNFCPNFFGAEEIHSTLGSNTHLI